ncbi:hypothetical protein CBS147321_2581 [Aspergillus niger]|nr:hypothetical protein CBS11350_8545 [Aspergillus niger]KAI2840893.1 hypothetical protein CBS12448_10522 [Aspergillus niger]KAI2908522.1 hypothetical protein CBS147371_10034 [Aspergillus niger]KAI2934449.1 hypothetical protein CBS147320_1025 [Aspergillus niger]KAI2938387.1 hypothetical protein CBS147322_10605 [Aspergillus niger]
MPKSSQYSLPATYYRGGTSKALFFREDVLPGPGPQRDRLLKRAMGSPDPLQLDGMGGSKAVTSKIAIVRPSTRSDADIDFTFAQVGVARDFIHYGANCGNISAAVGPFAIEEGLVQFRPGRSVDTTVKTQERSGAFEPEGTHEIAGVPGKGSPVLLDYRFTIGAELSRGLLPTGNASDMITVAKKEIEITICDIANLCVFANARDFNITGHETAADLTANLDWLAKTQELLGKAAVLAGMSENWKAWIEKSQAVVAPDPDPSKAHLAARLFLDKMCHESMAGTGAICTTACSRIPGSVVNRVIGDAMELDTLEISHAAGTMAVFVQTEMPMKDDPIFETLSFVRTVRRIMDGTIYVPDSFRPDAPAKRSVSNVLPLGYGFIFN